METVEYSGYECVSLENDSIRMLVTRSIGPRIIWFGLRSGENLFAELPDFVTDCPGTGTFHFYGGHRLWHAPEEPARTYLPDDLPVEISPLERGLLVSQRTEPQTGLQKSIEIYITGERQVVLKHSIHNHGLWEVLCAPWAITQLKTGGVAILPQTRQDSGVLPNRSLVLWPYTNMTSPNVYWGNEFILVQAEMDAPFKVGSPNPRGWLAYWWNGILFVKRAEYNPAACYTNFGSSTEMYCNQEFIELETLAPMSTIAPGDKAVHIETWHLVEGIDRPRDEKDAQQIAQRLGLG